MAYTPRYLWTFHNELNELVEIYFDAKDGVGEVFTGSATIVVLTPNGFNLAAGMEIDAIQIGNQITFDGHTGTIVSFSPDLDFTYTITVAESVFTPGPPSVRTYTVGPAGTDPGLQTFENIVECKLNKSSDNSLITDPIVWSELDFTVNLTKDSTIEFETFLTSNHDDWQVRMEVDGQKVFHGFLVPDEGSILLQDKPYDVNFKAVDGLKLLSNITLVRYDGTEFNAKHNYQELICACLQQTLLNLNVRVYCNIYYNPMVTRANDYQYDAFQQMYLDYRTFMSSATEFINCYDALVLMLKDHFQLRYDKGMWVIYRITEAQYLPEGNRYYTDYEWTGSIQGGFIDGDDYGLVGQNQITRAIEETQTLSAKFAYKTVRHNFKYNIWDEIPRNNKFERTTVITGLGDATTKYYTIDDWDYLEKDVNFPGVQTTIGPAAGSAQEKRTFNTYGVELTREIVMTPDSSPGDYETNVLISKNVPVSAGDVIDVSFDFRSDLDTSSTIHCLSVFIIPADGSTIIQLFNGPPPNADKGVWTTGIRAGLYAGDPSGFGSPVNVYTNVSVTSEPIPKDGEMYVAFWGNTHHDMVANATWYFRNFTMTYHPYISGGFISVTGGYWSRSQNKRYQDTYTADVQVSDSLVGPGKGTLYFFNTAGQFPKTVSDWWRYGLGGSEIRAYTELVNLGIYNLTYRRFKSIEGDFDGTKYTNHVDLMQYPLSFTPRYKFEDLGDELYLLRCPVTIDYVKGRFTGAFQEVYASPADGTQEGDSSQFNYLFE